MICKNKQIFLLFTLHIRWPYDHMYCIFLEKPWLAWMYNIDAWIISLYKYVISYQNILCYFTSRKLWLKLKLKLLKSRDNNINLINRVCFCVYIFSVNNIFVVLITFLKYVCIQIGMLIHYMSVSFDNP